jgi:hypothetical protein
MPVSSRLPTSAGGHRATTLERSIAARVRDHASAPAIRARRRAPRPTCKPAAATNVALDSPIGPRRRRGSRQQVATISGGLRFDAGTGSSAVVLIPDLVRAAASPKREMGRLEGRGFTKMLRRNSDLKGFRARPGGFGELCNFATHCGKTMRCSAANHSFNCALRDRR